jgi:ATP-dependent Clp protease ATP-binding subunit ClpA
MDRVIAQRLKPLLTREILFGSLKNGGSITISAEMLTS